MSYKVRSIKYDGGEDYEVPEHGEYRDYEDAIVIAQQVHQSTKDHVFISSSEEVWNSTHGEVVDPLLIRKIRHLTETQRVALHQMVDYGLETNMAQKRDLPA